MELQLLQSQFMGYETGKLPDNKKDGENISGIFPDVGQDNMCKIDISTTTYSQDEYVILKTQAIYKVTGVTFLMGQNKKPSNKEMKILAKASKMAFELHQNKFIEMAKQPAFVGIELADKTEEELFISIQANFASNNSRFS